jgi:hypothetical protein
MSISNQSEKQPKNITPLWIISLFVSFSEALLVIAATKTFGESQVVLIKFSIAFPLIVAFAFFIMLWFKPWVFYSPNYFRNICDAQKYFEALKGTSIKIVKKTSDIQGEFEVVGDPDRMRLLFKVAGKSWERSTKAMKVGNGCIVQTSSKILTPDFSWNLAEALTYVPNVDIVEDANGKGLNLIQIDNQSKGKTA